MSKYIDVESLLNNLPDDIQYKASVKRVLMQAPSADVVEVRHGEWITPKCRDADDWKECSRCGYCFDVSVGHKPTPYCPECGAKMDGERKG